MRRRFLGLDTEWLTGRRVAIAITVVVVLVFLPAIMLQADHPFLLRRNITGWDLFFYSIFAMPVLGVLGLFWCALAVLALTRRVRGTWWMAAPVVAVVACTAVVALFPVPGFDDSREEMDALVAELRAKPPAFESFDPPLQVGALEIDWVDTRIPGEITLDDADASGFVVSGWIHRSGEAAPEDRGESGGSSELTRLDGPWWEFSYRW